MGAAKGNGNFIGQYGLNAPDPALNVSAAAGGSSNFHGGIA